ncbi:MAG: hypothetical protein V4722_23165 [Bacteroidota bacterium]
MKKYLIITGLSFMHFSLALGQNVGIGTTVPAGAYSLHVHKQGSSDVSIGITNASTTNADGRGVRMRMFDNDFSISNLEPNGKIQFATSVTSRMTISADGNVGINTTNPLYRLHVENGNRESLFIENPVVAATATVRILKGYPENSAHPVTALSVQSNGVPAAIFSSSSHDAFTALSTSDQTGIGSFGSTGFFVQSSSVTDATVLLVQSPGVGKGLHVLKTGTQGDGITVDVRSIGQSAIYALNHSTTGGFGVVAESNSGNSFEGRKNGTATGSTAYFQNTNAANTSPTVEISGNGSGNKLLITDASFAAASVQFSSNATNVLSISKQNSSGSGINVLASNGSNASGITAANNVNTTAASSYGVRGFAGNETFPSQLSGTIGVYGSSATTSQLGIGVAATSYSSNGAALLGWYLGTGNGNAIDLRNGYLRVSGPTKTAFIHTATSSNITGHVTSLSYPGAAATDMVIATQVYNPGGTPFGVYNSHPIAVYWFSNTWNIFNQDFVAMPVDAAFNVLVIKQ